MTEIGSLVIKTCFKLQDTKDLILKENKKQFEIKKMEKAEKVNSLRG